MAIRLAEKLLDDLGDPLVFAALVGFRRHLSQRDDLPAGGEELAQLAHCRRRHDPRTRQHDQPIGLRRVGKAEFALAHDRSVKLRVIHVVVVVVQGQHGLRQVVEPLLAGRFLDRFALAEHVGVHRFDRGDDGRPRDMLPERPHQREPGQVIGELLVHGPVGLVVELGGRPVRLAEALKRVVESVRDIHVHAEGGHEVGVQPPVEQRMPVPRSAESLAHYPRLALRVRDRRRAFAGQNPVGIVLRADAVPQVIQPRPVHQRQHPRLVALRPHLVEQRLLEGVPDILQVALPAPQAQLAVVVLRVPQADGAEVVCPQLVGLGADVIDQPQQQRADVIAAQLLEFLFKVARPRQRLPRQHVLEVTHPGAHRLGADKAIVDHQPRLIGEDALDRLPKLVAEAVVWVVPQCAKGAHRLLVHRVEVVAIGEGHFGGDRALPVHRDEPVSGRRFPTEAPFLVMRRNIARLLELQHVVFAHRHRLDVAQHIVVGIQSGLEGRTAADPQRLDAQIPHPELRVLPRQLPAEGPRRPVVLVVQPGFHPLCAQFINADADHPQPLVGHVRCLQPVPRMEDRAADAFGGHLTNLPPQPLLLQLVVEEPEGLRAVSGRRIEKLAVQFFHG